MQAMFTENQTLVLQKNAFEDNFENFFEAVGKQILGFSRRFCGWNDADDAMQETLMAAYKNLPNTQFENDNALRGWLFRIVKNNCLMRKRQSKHAPQNLLSIDTGLENTELGTGNAIEIADYSSQPDREMLRRELKSAIDTAVESLPIEQQKVFVLREVKGFSTKEVAELLCISEQNVKVRLHRAKTALQIKLHYLN